jgi:peptidoglycan hydrolase-like protein with peptidoglycan-binding domain
MSVLTKFRFLLLFFISTQFLFSIAGYAEGYNPVTQQAQTNLTAQGFNPGPLDGVFGTNTSTAIKAFQTQASLPISGSLDEATLQKLNIGVSVDKVNSVQDWRALPSQAEIDGLLAGGALYANYQPYAAGANLDIPGSAILAAMNKSADTYGSRRKGQAGHTDQGYKYLTGCLKTGYAPTHWSDLTLHYYCQMSQPRACYTYASSGKSTGGVKLPRTKAYQGCATGRLDKSADFAWVVNNQALVFQFVMFGQTHAFNHEQEQAVINAFYGVNNPNDKNECRLKRPRRTEDPANGTHCLVNKTMSTKLVGKGT